MDWYLAGDDRAALRELRRTISGYLERHAAEDADVGSAALVVEELVGNAARHAGGPVWVSLDWAQLEPVVTVRDLGPGFDPSLLEQTEHAPVGGWTGALAQPDAVAVPDDPGGIDDLESLEELAEGGRGFFLVHTLAHSLQARARRGGGMLVTATLDVQRTRPVSYDMPVHTGDALPRLDEARPEGAFGKESFLRALVVQLARAVELRGGPEAAEAAVAQVGADVGGQMEAEYRAAERVVGRMSPQELGRCFVRLKHAIDGGFRVVEADESHIELVNDRCPFGDAVRLAPALCRMTSSVFGGIAARNSDDGASVVLAERIAVGDPGCRVVVHLRSPSPSVEVVAHHYAAPG